MLNQQIQSLIRDQRLVQPGDDVLVGVSGGPDSLCLLNILWQMRHAGAFSLQAAHLNHRLRGREADRDEALVRAWCCQHDIPCAVKRVNVRQLAAAQKRSLEDASRQARLAFFRACCRRLKRPKLALAHTRDDQAETVVMRLVRGTGIPGLAGMRFLSFYEGLPIIRPLLSTPKQEILRYTAAAKIPYRVDASNLSAVYTRNRVRWEVMPLLEKLNPGARDHLARLAECAQQAEDELDKRARQVFQRLSRRDSPPRVRFKRRDLQRLSPEVCRRVLLLGISRVKGSAKDIDYMHIGQLEKFLAETNRSGRTLTLPRGMRVRSQGDDIIIQEGLVTRGRARQQRMLALNTPRRMPDLGYEFSLTSSRWPGRRQHTSGRVEYFDKDQLRQPLIVRTRRPGDVFWPLGAPGKKKLSDFFIDHKVDAEERDRVPLVVSGKTIIWVVGHRLSDLVKITPRTRRVVRLAARLIRARACRSS